MLNIRDPRAHDLAKELAGATHSTITNAVITALEHELKRVRSAVPLHERLAAIAARALANKGPNPREVTKADIDDMWSR
jgi:antitoxin VapB